MRIGPGRDPVRQAAANDQDGTKTGGDPAWASDVSASNLLVTIAERARRPCGGKVVASGRGDCAQRPAFPRLSTARSSDRRWTTVPNRSLMRRTNSTVV